MAVKTETEKYAEILHTNYENCSRNATGEFLQLLVDARCQVVNTYALVIAACCYDVAAHKQQC